MNSLISKFSKLNTFVNLVRFQIYPYPEAQNVDYPWCDTWQESHNVFIIYESQNHVDATDMAQDLY